MRLKCIFIIITLFHFACGETEQKQINNQKLTTTEQIAFEAKKWKTKKDGKYPHRDSMIEDVVFNKKIRDLKKGELIHVLGEPERIENNHLHYLISQKKLIAWPLSTKTMVIKISDSDSIEWIKVHG